jgi:hypothetical protein
MTGWKAMRGRISAAVGLTVALLMIGSSGAAAWTWATYSSPQHAYYNSVSRGAGYGEAYRSGYNTVVITAALKDSYINGRGAYHTSTVWKPGDTRRIPVTSETGRYEGASWKNMTTRFVDTLTSSAGMYANSKVCEDASWQPDICSTNRASAL